MKPILAVAQMTSKDDLEANFGQVESLAREAKAKGASLICFPENFAYLAKNEADGFNGQSLEGPLFTKYRNLARQLCVEISYGGFHEVTKDNQHFNTHVLVSARGDIAATYRKIHLFVVDIPNGPQFDETKTFSPGTSTVVAPSSVGRLGLSICFDLRFSELYRTLAESHAEILLVPSAFTSQTGLAHWEPLIRTRAIENQCYVAAAAQYGTHYPGRETHGHSMIVDPFGAILAQCFQGIGVALAEIDPEFLKLVRRNMPMRRPQQ